MAAMLPISTCKRKRSKVDANTVRTIERAYGRDSDGRKTLVQVNEEERRTFPGGVTKTVRTTSNPDANGGLQVVQRETQDARQIGPNVQETKSTFFTASGMAAWLRPCRRRNATRRLASTMWSFASPLCCLI